MEKIGRKRILVIDDEAPIRNYLKRMLEEEGYSVTQSWGGNDGLAKLSAEVFDMVITDMSMPDKTGIQIIIKIRETKRPVKIVVMSGDIKNDWLLRIADFYKADATIKKPFIRPEVLSAVKKVLYGYSDLRVDDKAILRH